MASRSRSATAAAKGGAPAQERELRAQGRKTMRKLLDAGRVVFEQRGYHAARVDDVVKMAKTSHGTFYLYFSNKEDLFKALADDAMNEMAGLSDELGNIGSDEDGRLALRVWIEHFHDTYSRHSTIIRAWTEGEIVDNDLGRQGQRLLGQLVQTMADRIAEADSGVVDPDVAALACLSMLERFIYLAQSRKIEFDREGMLDTLTSVAHTGFFGGQPAVGRPRRLRRAR
jgi:AcrR family transcriptional regulator